MKSIRRFSLFRVLVLAIGAMGASAIPAHAQTANRNFHSYSQSPLGRRVLPPGDYAFSLDSHSFAGASHGPPGRWFQVAIVLPQAISDGNTHRRRQSDSPPEKAENQS